MKGSDHMLATIIITAVVTALVTHFAPKAWVYYRVTRKRPSPLGYVEEIDLTNRIIKVKVTPAVSKRESVGGGVPGANRVLSMDDELAIQDMDDELTAFHSEIWGDEPRKV